MSEMFETKQVYLSSLPKDFMGYIAELRPAAPDIFDDAVVWVDHVHDRLTLRVQYVLLRRGEIDRDPRGYSRLVGARIRQALCISDDPTMQARRLRVARRQMLDRGRDAAKRKAARC